MVVCNVHSTVAYWGIVSLLNWIDSVVDAGEVALYWFTLPSVFYSYALLNACCRLGFNTLLIL